jgi:GAF domain-containing protein
MGRRYPVDVVMSNSESSETVLPLDISRSLRDLLVGTQASRVTLRLDVVGMNFPVVGEAVDSVAALSGNHSLDQRNLETVRHLFRTHDVLIQGDCRAADPAPPAALIGAYGVKAQMLAPILREHRVVGWISVHDCVRTRSWRGADVQALRGTVQLISAAFLGPEHQPTESPIAAQQDMEGKS